MSVASMVWGAARNAYRKDRANRYDLKAASVLPDLCLVLPPYDGPYIKVEPLPTGSRVTVKPYSGDVCDGATFVPDNIRGILPAALFHDPWYLEIPAIAAAWGWTETAVQRLGDGILATIQQRAGGSTRVAGLFYTALYRFGAAFRWVGKRTAVVMVCGVTVAAGCIAPPDYSDPASPYVPPCYSQTVGRASLPWHVQPGTSNFLPVVRLDAVPPISNRYAAMTPQERTVADGRRRKGGTRQGGSGRVRHGHATGGVRRRRD